MIRKLTITVLSLVTIFEFWELIRDFAASEPIHYFAMQPGRLLWVVALCAGGGLIACFYSRLSSQRKWHAQLITLASTASCFTIFCVYVFYQITCLSREVGLHLGPLQIMKSILWPVGPAALLWFEFYRVAKRRSAF
jgi:hypothetical protein